MVALYCVTCASVIGVANVTHAIKEGNAETDARLSALDRKFKSWIRDAILPDWVPGGDRSDRPTSDAPNLSADQKDVIGEIISTGRSLGATDKDLEIAIATCLVESNCTTGEDVRGKDLDSIGPFQQRPSQGWPNSEDPETQATAFFQGSTTNQGLLSLADKSDPGAAAQAVQRSAYPERYAERMDEARQILTSFVSGGSSPQGNKSFPLQGDPSAFAPDSNLAEFSKSRTITIKGQTQTRPHNGIDLPCPVGAPILAYADGKIKYLDDPNGYGLAIFIEHPDGTQTLYGHNSARLVPDGSTVSSGNAIAECGSTGNSSGSHLHFEFHPPNGFPVDPRPYLEPLGLPSR